MRILIFNSVSRKVYWKLCARNESSRRAFSYSTHVRWFLTCFYQVNEAGVYKRGELTRMLCSSNNGYYTFQFRHPFWEIGKIEKVESMIETGRKNLVAISDSAIFIFPISDNGGWRNWNRVADIRRTYGMLGFNNKQWLTFYQLRVFHKEQQVQHTSHCQ